MGFFPGGDAPAGETTPPEEGESLPEELPPGRSGEPPKGVVADNEVIPGGVDELPD